MSQELILIRGLPGSGKSTLAREYGSQGYVHLEADMYFEVNGKYHYDQTLVAEAHDWCASEVRKALADGKSVVVTNTFSRRWEMGKYKDAAIFYGVPVRVIEATGSFQNIHNIPPEVVQTMRERWESL